jgi:DNA-binding transcriptional LysR family regulator
MEWSDLKIFLAVARAGTLAGAAKRIGQTQPTMGRRLRTLEAAVGDALFQRTREGFVLTAEGTMMLAHAERIEEEVLGLERKLSGRDADLDGLIRVSSSDWFGVHMLTPVFAKYSQRHPRVTIELLTDARLFSLSRREADMVFRIRPFEEADIVQRKLMHISYGLYGTRSTKVAGMSQGRDLSLVTMDAAFGGLPDVAWLKRLLPHARTAFGSNNREAQARMCAAGVGLAVLPRPLGDATPGLKLLDLGEAPPGRDVWVGYHRDMRRLTRLKALLDMAVDMLSG